MFLRIVENYLPDSKESHPKEYSNLYILQIKKHCIEFAKDVELFICLIIYGLVYNAITSSYCIYYYYYY
jgi:hypothetical protein